jgi:hypothetical protein
MSEGVSLLQILSKASTPFKTKPSDDVYDELICINKDFKDKHLWILKSTGLGITELFLRIIGWLCTKDDSLKDTQVCIVTGPRIELSTPNRPGSLFDTIEREKEQECIYKRLKLDYTYGLGKIYTKEDIEKQKQSPSFKREYDLQYLGHIGNTFHTKDIDRTVELGNKYNPNSVVVSAPKILGLDPAWGSSAFGLVLLQVSDGMIQVLMADEYERPRCQDMADKVMDLI